MNIFIDQCAVEMKPPGKPRLNLNGVWKSPSRKKITPSIFQMKMKKKVEPQIEQKPISSIELKPSTSKKKSPIYMIHNVRLSLKYTTIVFVSLCVVFFIITMCFSSVNHGLRPHIEKVSCTVERGYYVCRSGFNSGKMILQMTAECKRYVYEINGVPFVRVSDFDKKVMTIDAHSEVRVRDARPGCVLVAYHTNYGYHESSDESSSGLVWITSAKHTHFTMSARGEVVLNETPASIIQSSRNGEWVAYTLPLEMLNLKKSDIHISGNSRDPIFIYL